MVRFIELLILFDASILGLTLSFVISLSNLVNTSSSPVGFSAYVPFCGVLFLPDICCLRLFIPSFFFFFYP